MPATQATDRVLIQAGHSAQFPPYRTGGGGAPGEAAWATDLAAVLTGRLRAAGVEVVCVGAWLVNGIVGSAPASVTDEDYDLFISLHYDANLGPTYNTGGFADRYRPERFPKTDPRSKYPNPNAANEDRFIAIWERRYPEATGIPLRNERRNPNSYDYYGYSATTERTCSVLLEHGVGQGLDHATLFDRIDEVARVDAACVLEYLGITAPEEEDDMAKLSEDQRAILDKMTGLNANSGSIDSWLSEIGALGEENDKLREEVASLTERLTNADLVTERTIVSVAVNRKDGQVELVQ
jgi:hypothetical protein